MIIKTVKIKIINNDIKPNLVIKLAGPDVDEIKASIPYFIRKNILDLDLPFFLKGLSNSMPFCFNPT